MKQKPERAFYRERRQVKAGVEQKSQINYGWCNDVRRACDAFFKQRGMSADYRTNYKKEK